MFFNNFFKKSEQRQEPFDLEDLIKYFYELKGEIKKDLETNKKGYSSEVDLFHDLRTKTTFNRDSKFIRFYTKFYFLVQLNGVKRFVGLGDININIEQYIGEDKDVFNNSLDLNSNFFPYLLDELNKNGEEERISGLAKDVFTAYSPFLSLFALELVNYVLSDPDYSKRLMGEDKFLAHANNKRVPFLIDDLSSGILNPDSSMAVHGSFYDYFVDSELKHPENYGSFRKKLYEEVFNEFRLSGEKFRWHLVYSILKNFHDFETR